MKRLRFFLVGPGRAGISLASAWSKAGHRCLGIEGGTPSARRQAARVIAGKEIGARGSSHPDFDLLVLTPPDREVAKVARDWSNRMKWRGKRAIHASGSLSVQALESLSRAGASVAAIHPLTSLPRPDGGGTAFRGVYFGVEGSPSALRWARRLAREAGGIPFEIPRQAKPFYHLCACLASGYLLALLDSAAVRMGDKGVSSTQARKALLVLAQVTLANAQKMGPGQALTGPVPRGDLSTLGEHLHALSGQPLHWVAIHRGLVVEALALAVREGRISPATAKRIIQMEVGGTR